MSDNKLSNLQETIDDSREFLIEVKKFINKNFKVNGRTLSEWENHFKIIIPPEIDFIILVNLASEIAEKYQEAAYFRDHQMVRLAVLDQERTDRWITAYEHTRQEHERTYKKNLSAKSCENSANLAVKSLDDAMIIQKAVKEFWTKICTTLQETRKNIEIIGYALGAEVRTQKDFKINATD
jgi:hypothetical protein